MKLLDYIDLHYESQRHFAKHQGIRYQQVTPWLRDEWQVIGNTLHSPRRTIKPPPLPATPS